MRNHLKAIVFIVLMILPVTSKAYYDFCVNNILYSYVYENGEKTNKVMVADDFREYRDGSYGNFIHYNGHITIPEKIYVNNEEYTVVGIADNAFRSSKVTEVTLPPTVTHIGDRAFSGSRLERIDLSYITSISGSSTFSGTNIQDTIKWPSDVSYIPKFAFYGSKIEHIIIPETVTQIGDQAFEFSMIEQIELPKNLSVLSKEAFMFTPLRSIDIPGSVTEIGANCFAHCDSLTSAVMHIGTKVLGYEAFAYCPLLRGVVLPEGLEVIGSSCFYENDSIRTIIVPEGVTTFERTTFSHSLGLRTVVLPSTLKYFCSRSLCGCIRVTDVYSYSMLPSLAPYHNIDCGGSPFLGCNGYVGCTHKWDYPEKNCYCQSDPPSFAVAHIPSESGLYNDAMYRGGDDMNSNPWCRFQTFKALGDTYTLTYMIDNEVFAQQRYPEGVQIDALGDIYRNYSTFSGWSEIPEFMPSHDIVVYGSFTSPIPTSILETNMKNAESFGSESYYDIHGHKLLSPTRGINIFRKSDGTTKKVYVK